MRPKKILVVDDSATMRKLLTMLIRKVAGSVELAEAGNGRDALARLAEEPFDLVLTDMQMPEMDGASLIGRIRADFGAGLPIIVITTKGEERDRDAGLASGANSYLSKPINPSELKAAVAAHLT